MIVYLAGGINGLPDADCKDWREHAKKRFVEVGIECLDPMRRDYRGVEADHLSDIVHGDICDINESDVVLAMCPKPSWGTAMEIRYAFAEVSKRVVVVCADPKPSPWLLYHCESLHRNLDEAIDNIIQRLHA